MSAWALCFSEALPRGLSEAMYVWVKPMYGPARAMQGKNFRQITRKVKDAAATPIERRIAMKKKRKLPKKITHDV